VFSKQNSFFCCVVLVDIAFVIKQHNKTKLFVLFKLISFRRKKRFSDFEELYKALSPEASARIGKPKKGAIMPDLERRRESLELFLQEAVSIA
jgi:hypothetical protein